MDLLVHYLPETNHEVKVKSQTSVIFGHCKANDIVKGMLHVLDKLAVAIMLVVSLGMDGPNFSKSIMEMFNQVKREKTSSIGKKCPPSCLIHMCHNSFQEVLIKCGYNSEELCLNLYYIFKRS